MTPEEVQSILEKGDVGRLEAGGTYVLILDNGSVPLATLRAFLQYVQEHLGARMVALTKSADGAAQLFRVESDGGPR